MINLNAISCTGCAACEAICPTHCIKMSENLEGFLYPVIDNKACVGCCICEKVCPIMSKPARRDIPEAYAVQAKDRDVVKRSSSGGMFYVLADQILEQGGVVFGAAFNEKFDVEHICIETKGDIALLQGSKYVQSDLSGIYEKIEHFLKENRKVLFVGTPCQVEGIASYINQKKIKGDLLLVDLLCHGVPSREVWRRYLRYRKNTDGGVPTEIFFRSKNISWKSYSMRFEYKDRPAYSATLQEDMYLKGFLRNVYLRNSCYRCEFKSLGRVSDLTIGDFWGIDQFSDKFDRNGTSLVLVHTAQGKKIIENTAAKVCLERIEDSTAIANGGLYESAFYNIERPLFFKSMHKKEFDTLYHDFFADKLMTKIRRCISRNKSKRG